MDEIERLEQAIVEAETKKREFVRTHPNGSGDKGERAKLYTEVEKARRELRAYKVNNPHILQ